MARNSAPTHSVRAKSGRKDAEGNDIFFQVGVGWTYRNGEGISLKLAALPVGFDGTLLVSPVKDE
jgi:hypothetical protein